MSDFKAKMHKRSYIGLRVYRPYRVGLLCLKTLEINAPSGIFWQENVPFCEFVLYLCHRRNFRGTGGPDPNFLKMGDGTSTYWDDKTPLNLYNSVNKNKRLKSTVHLTVLLSLRCSRQLTNSRSVVAQYLFHLSMQVKAFVPIYRH